MRDPHMLLGRPRTAAAIEGPGARPAAGEANAVGMQDSLPQLDDR
jgi:hypothetical protein